MVEPKTLARPYARAAFDYARGNGELTDWELVLTELAAVSLEPKVVELINSPTQSGEQLAMALLGLVEVDVPASVQNFIKILAENDRLLLLPEVAALYSEQKQALETSVAVEVTSAFDLSDSDVADLEKSLERQLSRSVSLTHQTDSALLGGAVIRAGDMVIAGYVRGRLAKLAGALTP